jgi:DNA replication protein DnaC
MNPTPTDCQALRKRLHPLALFGLLAEDDALLREPWVEQLVEIEEAERHRRSLVRRLRDAKLGTFKPLTDFDWQWPEHIDRALFNELLPGDFIHDATNVVFVGPNGVGKSMLAKNLIHNAVLNGASARFVTASDMLHDLAAQESTAALARRLKRYTLPHLLCIDEVGYLAYDNRYADLLFEVVTRRYQLRPILLTTNKSFNEWNDIFPNAACVVTLIDRLVHRSEILAIEGQSYRLKEAQERTDKRNADKAKPNKLTAGKTP